MSLSSILFTKSLPYAFATHGRKIVAIGRNYADHIKELNNAPAGKEPFFFLKPTSSYLPAGGKLEIPKGIIAHHEVELGLVIGKGGRDISSSSALSHIAGYALAVDMTARNLQDRVKKKGLPWSAAKGFDTFTPIGTYISKDQIKDPQALGLTLKINGVTKQDGTTGDMIFPIPKLIEHISSIMSLEEGDLILTGTPAGVGPVNPGDRVWCALSQDGKEVSTIEFKAEERVGGYEFTPE
ncbi:hypothetical protein DL96DRAFT_525336 [Flagelloscypha sp. PMI_526]|nr:hypothetical protein DL96DRAFT_525336 [Flagelloscypha sp. PMI_526]